LVPGTSEITLTAALGGSAAVDERTFSITVDERDWVVFISDHAERFSDQLYAVRLSSNLLPVSRFVGPEIPDGASVSEFAWSKDGSRIAFVAGSSDANADIYVADMTGQAIGTAVAQGVDLGVMDSGTLHWSPDGERLIFDHFSKRVGVDLSVTPPTTVEFEAGGRGVRWLDNETIGYSVSMTPNHSIERVTWPRGGAAGASQDLPFDGACVGPTCSISIQTRLDYGVYEVFVTTPGGDARERHVLFTESESGWSSVADQSSTAVSLMNFDYSLGIQEAFSGTSISVVSVDGSPSRELAGMGDDYVFAPGSNTAMVATTGGQIQLMDAAAAPLSPEPVEGDYGAPGQCFHQFSPNEKWLSYFDVDDEVYVIPVDGTTAGAPVKLGEAGGLGAFSGATFSSDSNSFAFLADRERSEERDLYYVDLSGDVPKQPLLVSGVPGGWGQWEGVTAFARYSCAGNTETTTSTFSFSPNSAHLVYTARDDERKVTLWVTPVLDRNTGETLPAPQAQERTGTFSCTTSCGGVSRFEFQP